MIQARTLVILIAGGLLALSAGFSTNYLMRGGAPWALFGAEGAGAAGISDDKDTDALFAARMPDLAGRQTSLGAWRGKLLVVNFWATWCAPCREEIPDFVRMQSEFGPKGVQFVGIAADQADKVKPFATDFQINYPLLIGNFGALELARRVGDRNSVLPFSVVLDRGGHIVHRQLGVLKMDKLREIFGEQL